MEKCSNSSISDSRTNSLFSFLITVTSTPQAQKNYNYSYNAKIITIAILLYRICRCCRRIYVKLLHTVFHALAIPCVAVGFVAVLDSHNLKQPTPIPNFYSLHSWIGLVTMGLFAIQISKNLKAIKY
ncbi:hypothetical protein NQ315_005443 [Exocentrus adspersus]|uniref:Cytochrome b561 domain-containing protein n=1 Tax=Exocentrus adspersus TaxID=1586481 RepID=A0AAV8VD32_9CUCU|nr:hypothetical protein NQ315_005443 [Exocentrus adspersus]